MSGFIRGDFVGFDLILKPLFLLLVEISNLFLAGLQPVLLEVVKALPYALRGIRNYFLECPGSLLYACLETVRDFFQLLHHLLELRTLFAFGRFRVHGLGVHDFHFAALQRCFHLFHQ